MSQIRHIRRLRLPRVIRIVLPGGLPARSRAQGCDVLEYSVVICLIGRQELPLQGVHLLLYVPLPVGVHLLLHLVNPLLIFYQAFQDVDFVRIGHLELLFPIEQGTLRERWRRFVFFVCGGCVGFSTFQSVNDGRRGVGGRGLLFCCEFSAMVTHVCKVFHLRDDDRFLGRAPPPEDHGPCRATADESVGHSCCLS